jgi:hypothetical protein
MVGLSDVLLRITKFLFTGPVNLVGTSENFIGSRIKGNERTRGGIKVSLKH